MQVIKWNKNTTELTDKQVMLLQHILEMIGKLAYDTSNECRRKVRAVKFNFAWLFIQLQHTAANMPYSSLGEVSTHNLLTVRFRALFLNVDVKFLEFDWLRMFVIWRNRCLVGLFPILLCGSFLKIADKPRDRQGFFIYSTGITWRITRFLKSGGEMRN